MAIARSPSWYQLLTFLCAWNEDKLELVASIETISFPKKVGKVSKAQILTWPDFWRASVANLRSRSILGGAHSFLWRHFFRVLPGIISLCFIFGFRFLSGVDWVIPFCTPHLIRDFPTRVSHIFQFSSIFHLQNLWHERWYKSQVSLFWKPIPPKNPKIWTTAVITQKPNRCSPLP